MADNLVLSLFPGIGLLDMAFEEEGFCVVRGPDLLWGGDIRRFHPPAGVFDGVIGGPPCQAFSALRHLIRHNGHKPRFGNMIPEYERVVFEAQPRYFLMENVPDAPIPTVAGYRTVNQIVRDCWVGGTQPRARRFCFGVLEGGEINAPAGLGIEWAALMMPLMEARSIVADSRIGSTGSRVRHKGGGKRAHGESGSPARVTSIADACEAMGLARDFTDHMPFTMHGKRSAIGNGVPLPMGRAVARAVTEALRGR